MLEPSLNHRMELKLYFYTHINRELGLEILGVPLPHQNHKLINVGTVEVHNQMDIH